jgi:hypothetical protein
MAQQETAAAQHAEPQKPAVDAGRTPLEARPSDPVPIAAPIAAFGLPAGIRWWEACGGWRARYALGTF